jgi:DHA1 family tetracycline resistance protein-like MFS transporter
MTARLLPILAVTFIDILGFSMLIPVLPYFITHFGASATTVGAIFATFSFCQLVSGPLWGRVSDQFGRKIVLIVSQAGATIGWLLLAFAPALPWVFAARILEGVSGGNIGISQAYIADLVPPAERARAFGYLSAAFGAGMVFGPLGGALLYARGGFSAPFVAAAALQLCTLVLTIAVLPESRPRHRRTGPSPLRSLLRETRLQRLFALRLALSLALYAWFAVFALYLKARMGWSLMQTDLAFASFAVLQVGINAFGVGRLSERLGDRTMANLGVLALVGAFAAAPFVRSLPSVAAMATLFAFGMALATTGIGALLSAASPSGDQGTVLATGSALDALAGALAPVPAGWMLTRFGDGAASLPSLIFAAIAVVLGLHPAFIAATPARSPGLPE